MRRRRREILTTRIQRPGNGWSSDYSVTSLQAKGVIFIACGRSLSRLARDIAGPAGAPETLVELRKHILPGVETVPAMVTALCRAQEERVAYMHVG